MASAQIAIPLTDHDPTIEWLSTLVVVAFAATTSALTVGHWGPGRAGAAFAFVIVATLAAERAGTSTGVLFGDYEYTGSLMPTLAGVPVIVPLAWFAMGVPALELGRRVSASAVVAVPVAALALTAWDLFLDPQMVDAGYWTWASAGDFHGIPWTNYAGWLGVGLVVLGVLWAIRPAAPPGTTHVWLYTWWAVMNTVGFVVFFGEPFVGLAGGLGMGTCAAVAWFRPAAGARG